MQLTGVGDGGCLPTETPPSLHINREPLTSAERAP